MEDLKLILLLSDTAILIAFLINHNRTMTKVITIANITLSIASFAGLFSLFSAIILLAAAIVGIINLYFWCDSVVTLSENWFRKGDIIQASDEQQYRVVSKGKLTGAGDYEYRLMKDIEQEMAIKYKGR